jgi:multidrug efflux pump subunit AcrA (membrane-fusion protein)
LLAPDAGTAWAAGGGFAMKGLDTGQQAGTGTSATGERPELVDPGGDLASQRSRWVIGVVALALVAAGAVIVIGSVLERGGGRNGPADNGFATSLATVTRGSLSTQTRFNGTLGYAGDYTILGRAPGTVTWLPKVGQVIRQGHVLFRVNEAPVVLLCGSIPAYRRLAEGAAADVTGVDVAQLNHDLVALGYVDRADVDSAWDEFTGATKAGVQKLQAHLGVDPTGDLPLGAVVFLPTAARVTMLLAITGAPAAGPVLHASSTARTVSIALPPDMESEVKKGNRVTIMLPDGTSTPGRVASVGKVAAPSSSSGGPDIGPTVPVQIRPTDPKATGSLDQALVEVEITNQTVYNVLSVPVTALLARSGGGYSVETVASDGTHRLVRVTPGLFDDAAGTVQLSGPGLTAGQQVVVPGRG